MRFEMQYFFAAGYDSDDLSDYRGLDLLRKRWEERHPEGPEFIYTYIIFQYSDPGREELRQMFREVEREYPIEYHDGRIRIIFTDKEEYFLLESVWAQACDERDIRKVAFDNHFIVHEQGDGRSFVEQTSMLHLDLKGLEDFSNASYDARNLATIISKRFRALLEEHKAEVSFKEVVDRRTNRVSEEFFQLQIKPTLAVHPQTKIIADYAQMDKTRRYPGYFFYDYKDPRNGDLYFSRSACQGIPIFQTEHHRGPGKYLNDACRQIVLSQALFTAFDQAGMRGIVPSPVYLVDDDTPPIWGGTFIFGQEKFMCGNYSDWYDARIKALESILGKADDQVYSPRVPLHLGGEASVFVFPNHMEGVAYVTSDLIGLSDQPPNEMGQYELMICTREACDWAPDLISRLARYTLEEPLEPGETMDIGPALPEGSSIAALLFVKPESLGESFEVMGVKSGILLCVGITQAESDICQKGGSVEVLERLKDKSVFPFTDLERHSVS